jgi:hypothetical protein
MDALRDVAFALSVERRSSGEAQRDAFLVADAPAKSRPEVVLFSPGDRVLVQDTFERPCGVQSPFWWEAVVTAITAERDYVRARGRAMSAAQVPLRVPLQW